MAREWKSNEATCCRWEMEWEEGTTFIICLSEMPVSHRWNCCQLPQMPFVLTRLLSVASFCFNPKPPLSPYSRTIYGNIRVLSKQNSIRNTSSPLRAQRDRVWAATVVDVPSHRKLKVVLRPEYFGADGVLLLSRSTLCLCRSLIYILLIIQQGRGG